LSSSPYPIIHSASKGLSPWLLQPAEHQVKRKVGCLGPKGCAGTPRMVSGDSPECLSREPGRQVPGISLFNIQHHLLRRCCIWKDHLAKSWLGIVLVRELPPLIGRGLSLPSTGHLPRLFTES
jgi:hypothetical protein